MTLELLHGIREKSIQLV